MSAAAAVSSATQAHASSSKEHKRSSKSTKSGGASTRPSSADDSREASTRSSRLNSLSNGSLNASSSSSSSVSKSGNTDATSTPTSPTTPSLSRAPSSPLPSGYSTPYPYGPGSSGAANASQLGGALQQLVDSLEDRLKRQAESPGFVGRIASRALEQGHYIQHRVEEEVFFRKGAIGGLDNMWLLLSSTTSAFNPVCAATYTFESVPTREALTEALTRQSEMFPKYKQKLAGLGKRWHGTVFIDDPEWSVDRHFSIQQLPGKAGKRELEDFTAEFLARDWDYDKPLWECVVFDNYENPDMGSRGAMVTRGHHTLADGQGFVMSQLFITSYGPELERLLHDGKQTLRAARRGRAKPSKLHKALRPLDKYEHKPLLQLLMLALFWTMWMASVAADAWGSAVQAINIAFWFMFTSWRQRYATSLYAGERVKPKEFSTSVPFEMKDIKTMQKAFGGPTPGGWMDKLTGRRGKYVTGHITLNDVVVTIIGDAIIDEMNSQEIVQVPGIGPAITRAANRLFPSRLALMIPISIRPIGDTTMKNYSTGSVAYLPCGSENEGLPTGAKAMHRRLHANSGALSVLKRGWLPSIAFWMINLTGQAPMLFPSALWKPFQPIVRFCLELTLSSFTAVVTNVPGPQGHVRLADSDVIQWTASPPQAGKGTLGIGIISYNNRVRITIAADHIEGAPSAGVAHRLTQKIERRFKQYHEVAEEILDQAKAKRKA